MHEGTAYQPFFRYAIPQMVGPLSNSVYTIVDGIFIGNRLGQEAMAAAAVAVPLIEILISVALAVAASSGVLIATHLELREQGRVPIYFWGFSLAGFNILMISFWQSTRYTAKALAASLLRGVLLLPLAVIQQIGKVNPLGRSAPYSSTSVPRFARSAASKMLAAEARSWRAIPVESKTVISSGAVRPGTEPVITPPISPSRPERMPFL